MIRDRGSNFTTAFDAVLADAGIRTVLCNVRTPRMNALAERWIGGCRRELLDRTLIWNQSHLQQVLRDYESRAGGPAGAAARADQGRGEEMAGGMPAAGKGANGPGPAPGPDLALLPPAHRAVHLRPGTAGRRRRLPGPGQRGPSRRHRGSARALARHRETARQRERPAARRRPRPVKVSVPEARRLLRLATQPMTSAGRDLGHAWSRWRRRHQARARWHHYHARLKTAQVT